MATILINAAGGNWSAGGTWVGGIAPTAASDVDYSALTGTLTVDGTSGAPNLCRSFTATACVGTLAQASAKQINVGDGTAGAFKLVTGLTYAPSATSLIKFVSTTTGNNITSAGKFLPPLTFDGVGGGWQLQDDLGTQTNIVITLTNGALDTNGKTVGANVSVTAFSSSNSNTRSLTLGATTWNLAGNAATIWDIGTSTGMTLSAASSTLVFANTTNAQTFNGGGLTYGTVTSTVLTTGKIAFTGANTFGTLTTSIAGSTKTTTSGYIFPSGVTTTVTGTFTAAGNTLLLRNFLYSDTVGTAATISAGTFTITNTDLRDITKAGAGSGNISATSSSTGNGDCGGNTGWTFQAPRNVFMKTAVSVNWSAANWFTTSGGSTAAVPPLPLCHDTAIFDVNSVTAGGKTITLDQPRISGFTWSGVANTPVFAQGSTEYEVYGGVIFVSGMSVTGTGQVDLSGRGAFSLDGGTLTLPTGAIVNVNAPTGTYTLSRALTINANLTVTNGTLALGGFNFNAATHSININGGVVSGTGTISAGQTYTQTGGTVALGGTMTLGGAFALSGGTLNMNGNQITGHTTATISSTGTLNLSGQLNGSGAFSITGGTITDSGTSGELKGTTMSFSGGTSAIRKMTASSTFAISSTAALTFNPGVSTWVTSFTETGTTHSLTYNGKATNINGTLTVSSIGSAPILQSAIIQGLGAI